MRGILHIINGFCGNRVYANLIAELDALGINQLVYIPVRSKKDQTLLRNDELKNTVYRYSYINKSAPGRLLFFHKIRKIGRDIEKSVDFSTNRLIHAHTLFSDGGVARILHQKFGMEYLVAVRNTDVNFFFKYFFFLRGYGERILMEARQVIFLSPAYRETVLNRYVKKENRECIERKSLVVPSGTDPFWQTHIFRRSRFNNQKINLIYVGEIRRNKNIHTIVKAVEILRKQGWNARLSVVGYRLNDEPGYASRLKKECDTLDYVESVEQVRDRELLMKYYRDADIFIMASFAETFGLVYAEALTQGLPVVYSKGQGIDGYFRDGEAGFAVDPHDPEDIADKVARIRERYAEISQFCSAHAGQFDWPRIGQVYKSLYEK